LGTGIGTSTLAVTIVLDRRDGGALAVPAGSGKGPHAYRAYRDPVAIQVANLPLTNIRQRQDSSKGLRRPYKDPTTGKIEYPPIGSHLLGLSYDDTKATTNVDFNNDIYFIFAYTDEIINK